MSFHLEDPSWPILKCHICGKCTEGDEIICADCWDVFEPLDKVSISDIANYLRSRIGFGGQAEYVHDGTTIPYSDDDLAYLLCVVLDISEILGQQHGIAKYVEWLKSNMADDIESGEAKIDPAFFKHHVNEMKAFDGLSRKLQILEDKINGKLKKAAI